MARGRDEEREALTDVGTQDSLNDHTTRFLTQALPGATMGGSVSGGGHKKRLPDSKSCSLVEAEVVVEPTEKLLLHKIELGMVKETGVGGPMLVLW
jgi:hypothetical protein